MSWENLSEEERQSFLNSLPDEDRKRVMGELPPLEEGIFRAASAALLDIPRTYLEAHRMYTPPSGTLEKVAGYAGEVGGFLMPSGLTSNLFKGIKFVPKLAPAGSGLLRRMLAQGAETAVQGALYETPSTILKGEPLSNIPKKAAEWGALGAGGEVVGTGLRKIFPKKVVEIPSAEKEEVVIDDLIDKENRRGMAYNVIAAARKRGEAPIFQDYYQARQEMVENIPRKIPSTVPFAYEINKENSHNILSQQWSPPPKPLLQANKVHTYQALTNASNADILRGKALTNFIYKTQSPIQEGRYYRVTTSYGGFTNKVDEMMSGLGLLRKLGSAAKGQNKILDFQPVTNYPPTFDPLSAPSLLLDGIPYTDVKGITYSPITEGILVDAVENVVKPVTQKIGQFFGRGVDKIRLPVWYLPKDIFNVEAEMARMESKMRTDINIEFAPHGAAVLRVADIPGGETPVLREISDMDMLGRKVYKPFYDSENISDDQRLMFDIPDIYKKHISRINAETEMILNGIPEQQVMYKSLSDQLLSGKLTAEQIAGKQKMVQDIQSKLSMPSNEMLMKEYSTLNQEFESPLFQKPEMLIRKQANAQRIREIEKILQVKPLTDEQKIQLSNQLPPLMQEIQTGMMSDTSKQQLQIQLQKTNKEIQNSIAKSIESNKFPDGYIPHSRKGNQIVVGLNADGSLFAESFVENQIEATKEMIEMKQSGAFSVKTYLDTQLSRRIRELLPQDAIDAILDRTSQFGISAPELMADFRNTLYRSQRRYEKMNRKGTPGWKNKTFKEIMDIFDQQLQTAIHKNAKVKTIGPAQREVDALTDPNVKAYAQEHLNNLFTQSHNSWNYVRQTIGTFELALKPAFSIQNFLGMVMTHLPEAVNRTSFLGGHAVFGKALASTKNLIFNHGKKVEPELLKIYNELVSEGVLQHATWGEEIFHSAKESIFPHPPTAMTKLRKALMMVQSWSEIPIRIHSAFSGYYAGKAQGLTGKQLKEGMIDFINKADNAYGKINQPMLIQGQGALAEMGKTAYLFKGFVAMAMERMNAAYLSGLGKGIGKTLRGHPIEGFKAYTEKYSMSTKIAQLMSIGMVAGMFGIPGYKLTQKILANDGEDLDAKIRKYIENSKFSVVVNDAIEDGMRQMGFHPDQIKKAQKMKTDILLEGFPSLAGISTSSWAGMGDMPLTSYADVFGVLGGVVDPEKSMFVSSYKKAMAGKTWEAIEGILPAMMRNPAKGVRWMLEGGVRNQNGELIYEPEEWQAIMKGLGFPIRGEERAREKSWVEKKMVSTLREKTMVFARQLTEALAIGDTERYQKIISRLKEYNNSVAWDERIRISPQILKYRLLEYKGIKQYGGVPTQMRRRIYEYRKEE